MVKLKTIQIKGKEYVTVNERLRYFRENFPNHALISEWVSVTPEYAICRAVIKNADDKIIATGTAFEYKNDVSSMVNKTSHVENCESSAWGRALANLGIGIDGGVASAEEVASAIRKQGETDFMQGMKP